MDVLILVGMGAFAGMLAGLLGVGGGVIFVPALVLYFENQGIDTAVLMHLAIGTSLACITFTSISSIRSHHKHGAIRWPVFRSITPGILIGGLLGAVIARLIPGDELRVIFGIFLLLVALQVIVNKTAEARRGLPGRVGMTVAGVVIGSLASLMGVGGGTMSVPFLTWCNVAIHNAVATSASIGLPIALAGVTGFIVTGWGAPLRPEYSIGFVNLPAFMSIVVASFLFAPVGAKMAHRISSDRLKIIFGFFLLLLGAKMLV